MSQEDLQKFLEAVRQDSSLQEKLQAEGADPVAIAREAGFSVTQAEVIRAHASHVADLSDEELEVLAGGCGFASSLGIKGLTLAVVRCDAWGGHGLTPSTADQQTPTF